MSSCYSTSIASAIRRDLAHSAFLYTYDAARGEFLVVNGSALPAGHTFRIRVLDNAHVIHVTFPDEDQQIIKENLSLAARAVCHRNSEILWGRYDLDPSSGTLSYQEYIPDHGILQPFRMWMDHFNLFGRVFIDDLKNCIIPGGRDYWLSLGPVMPQVLNRGKDLPASTFAENSRAGAFRHVVQTIDPEYSVNAALDEFHISVPAKDHVCLELRYSYYIHSTPYILRAFGFYDAPYSNHDAMNIIANEICRMNLTLSPGESYGLNQRTGEFTYTRIGSCPGESITADACASDMSHAYDMLNDLLSSELINWCIHPYERGDDILYRLIQETI